MHLKNNYFLNAFFEKLKDMFLFPIIYFIFYKIRKGIQFFFLFILRLSIFCFVFPIFLISFFITLFFSFIFFFDSILIRGTPWILKKYPNDLSEDLDEPPLDGVRAKHTMKEISFELKTQEGINKFVRSYKLLSKSSFIKDIFIYLINLIKWYYLTIIKFLFLLRPGHDSSMDFESEADEADDELEETVITSLPLTDVEWWTDLFGVIRRLCVFFYIPIGIILFYIFINSFVVSIFSFFFFIFSFFFIYIYVLRIKFLKFFKFFVLIFIGNFTIRTLTNKLNLHALNIDENVEKIDNYYVTRGERRRIYYQRSLFYEDLRPFLKKIAEMEKFFIPEWNKILPTKFVSFLVKFRFLDLKPNFSKFAILLSHYFKYFFAIKKISNIFKITIFNLYSLLFKHLFSGKIFSYIFLIFLGIFQTFFFFTLYMFSFLSVFFQIFFFNFFKIILKILLDIVFRMYYFVLKIVISLNEFNYIYILLFKFILIYKILKINKLFLKFYKSRNIGFLHIIGIIYSIITKDNVSNNYKIFLKKWYNRFLFKNNEFYKFKDKKSSYVASAFLRNIRKNKLFFKQRSKEKYLNHLNLLFKTKDHEKKEILKALFYNQLLQKKFSEKVKYFDWYFENFVFYKYKIHSQLSNYKSVNFNSLWDWVKNYKLNVDSVKNLETSLLNQLTYRNNIPRLESSKFEFFLRNLFLHQRNQLNTFTYLFLFELIFYFFIVILFFSTNRDLFVIFCIIFVKFFFFLPLMLVYYYKYEKYIYRKLYVGNLLLIFRPIDFKTISAFKFCIPGLLNKFIKLRIKCEFSYMKLNYLINHKLTIIEIFKDYLRFFFILCMISYCYVFFFFKFFNFLCLFVCFFFSIFIDVTELSLFCFEFAKSLKEILSHNGSIFVNTKFFFNLFKNVDLLFSNTTKIYFFFCIIIFYTILFYFFFKYLYFSFFFLIQKNPFLITIFGSWLFLNVNPLFVINAYLNKKFELKSICKQSIQTHYQMNYSPKINLINLEKELKLIHITKYLSCHLLKKKV